MKDKERTEFVKYTSEKKYVTPMNGQQHACYANRITVECPQSYDNKGNYENIELIL